VKDGAAGDFFGLASTLGEHDQIRFCPMRFRRGFHLYEFYEVVVDDINVVRDFAPNALDRFVTQHLGDVKGGDTILKDEAVLGGYSASVIRFHLDFRGMNGFESMVITSSRPHS
jgi:hypothetical protein